MEHGGYARLGHQRVGNPFKGLAINGVAIRLGFLHRRTGADCTLLKFNAQALAVYGLLVAIPGKALNADRSDVPAEAAEALQKSHLNATPRRSYGCREPSGTRSHD